MAISIGCPMLQYSSYAEVDICKHKQSSLRSATKKPNYNNTNRIVKGPVFLVSGKEKYSFIPTQFKRVDFFSVILQQAGNCNTCIINIL